MQTYLHIAQIAVAVLMLTTILLQARGTGLGGTFGGEGNIYRTKRGIEKTLFISTIVFSVAFFGLAVTALILQQQ